MATSEFSAGLDSSGVRVAYGKETTYKTAPSSAFQRIRLLSESLSSTKSRTRPAEIKADGQASQAITTQVEATGDVGFGLSAGTYDDFLLASINADAFSAEVDTGPITDGSLTAAGVLSSAATDLSVHKVGTWVRTKGFLNEENNGVFRVTATEANALTLDGPGAGDFEAEPRALVGSMTVVAAATAKTFTIGSGTPFANFAVGMTIVVAGFTGGQASTNNGEFTITAIASNQRSITVAQTVGDQSSGNTGVTIQQKTNISLNNGGSARNGIDVNTLYIEKELTPAGASSKLFLRYPGCYVSGANIELAVGGFAEGTFTILASGEESATTTASASAATDAPSGVIVDTIGGVSNPGINDTGFDDSDSFNTILQSLSFTLTKEGAGSQYGIGSAEGLGIRKGTLTVEGSVSVYFRNFEMYRLFQDEESVTLSFALLDGEDDGYVFSFPNVTLVNPSITAGGPDTDLVAEFTMEGNPGKFTATETPAAKDFTIQIDKIGS